MLIKPLLNKDNYFKYKDALDNDFISKSYPDIHKIYLVLEALHRTHKEQYSINDLKVVFFTNYPRADIDSYNRLFSQLEENEVDSTHLESYLKECSNRSKAFQLSRLALRVAEGESDISEMQTRYESIKVSEVQNEDWKSLIVDNNLSRLKEKLQTTNGLRWRLASLNRALGSLRKGNFGFIFARPETGKTTFLSSELTYMAEQTERPLLWFNNEQAGDDVQERIFQAALGLTREELFANEIENNNKYAPIKDKLMLIDDGAISKGTIETICKQVNPSLIVIDQIDNVKGFKADRPDLEFKEIYQWARELAKEYGPVIGVCQAGGSGEDKKWLTMNDVDSSKTSKQGAADWILGIGKTREQGMEQVRYLHLSKNKLPGDADRDSRERHGQWQVAIQPEIARYTDI